MDERASIQNWRIVREWACGFLAVMSMLVPHDEGLRMLLLRPGLEEECGLLATPPPSSSLVHLPFCSLE